MAQGGHAQGMPANLLTIPATCEHCIVGKQTKRPVPKTRSGTQSANPLDIIYSDITGPEDIPMAGGNHYIINFINDHSDMLWLYLIKEKSDAIRVFKEWQALVEKEIGRTVKCYHTDNGGEFTSNTFEMHL